MGDINRIVVFVNLIQALSVRGFKNLRVNLSVLFIEIVSVENFELPKILSSPDCPFSACEVVKLFSQDYSSSAFS